MTKSGYCAECGKYTTLLEDDSCPNGHPRSSVRDVREGSAVTAVSVTRPSATPKKTVPTWVVMAAVLAFVVVVLGAGSAFTIARSRTHDAGTPAKAEGGSGSVQGAPDPEEAAPTVSGDRSAAPADGSSGDGVPYIGAMAPTVKPGMQFDVDYQAYASAAPSVGDLIYLTTDTGETGVRRVVGIPGDTIEIRGGMVVRNGAAVSEPYVQINDGHANDSTLRVPSGTIYVIGDNRSMLGQAAYGCIPKEWLKGRITLP